MANLTINVDEDVLRQARIRALEQGRSVNAILAEYLKSYADLRGAQVDATRMLIRLSRKSKSARGGRRWTRDELHER
jgi:plasmid stability protein